MKKLKQSTQFKKDLKRYSGNPQKMLALKNVTLSLREHGCVPPKFKPHKLSGNYKGFMECHIEDNFLLIWIDSEADVIKLVRLGTHHELFGK